MRTRSILAVLSAASLVISGCGDQPAPTEPMETTLEVDFIRGHLPHHSSLGGTFLSGAEEVPVRETKAKGLLTLKFSHDRQSIHYALVVSRIDNVLQAHLHLGPRGENGPIVAWLYPDAPPAVWLPGRTEGLLSYGSITQLYGPMEGRTIEELWAEIKAGNVYVNVHTNDMEGETNTGPGDFPGGEIRGQVLTK